MNSASLTPALMEKKENHYHLRINQTAAKAGTFEPASLELDFRNHDDVLEIVRRIQAKSLFANENEAAEFAIGLKLFSEVMLRHRTHPLFEELGPAFGQFMKKLKAL
jgi:hypothetical protein